MPNVPDYSQYVAVKKIRTAQTSNANTSIIKGRAPYMYDGYFPLYRSTNLPVNALLSNKFTSGTGGPVAPSFSPLDISGTRLWLDAADSNTFTFSSGSNISQWNDKSGSANNASALVGTTTLTNQGVVFTGSQALNTPLSSSMTNQTGFAILSYTSGTGTLDIISMRYISGVPGIQVVIDSNVQRIREWGGTTRVSGATLTPSTRLLYGYNYVAAGGAGTSNLYNNGTLTGTSSAAAVGFSGSGTIAIGAYIDNITLYEQFVGTINEIILYNSILTTLQRQQVEGYLAWKWGLQSSLPVGHPYKLAKP